MERRVPMAGSRFGLALLVALVAFAAAQTPKKAPPRHTKVAVEDPAAAALAQAEDAIAKKDYAAAEGSLTQLTQQSPSNFQAWFDLGFVLNALGKTDESIAAYRKSVAAKPDVFESNLNLGLMLAKANDPDAEQFLHSATQLKPTAHVDEGLARTWLSLAHVIEEKKPAEAIAAYQQVARLQPKDPEPHLSAGALLDKQGQADQAETEYKLALALDSKSSDATVGLANLYMKQKKLPEAEDLLRKLIVLRPDDPVVHLQLARVLAAEGKPEDAAAELQASSKSNPNDPALRR